MLAIIKWFIGLVTSRKLMMTLNRNKCCSRLSFWFIQLCSILIDKKETALCWVSDTIVFWNCALNSWALQSLSHDVDGHSFAHVWKVCWATSNRSTLDNLHICLFYVFIFFPLWFTFQKLCWHILLFSNSKKLSNWKRLRWLLNNSIWLHITHKVFIYIL